MKANWKQEWLKMLQKKKKNVNPKLEQIRFLQLIEKRKKKKKKKKKKHLSRNYSKKPFMG